MFYHDNTNGPMYENGQLSNNWDPNRDFPKDSYIRAYFRIETKGFNQYGYFDNPADREAFYADMEALFARFSIYEGIGLEAAEKGVITHLYIHPQELTGVVRQADVKAIAEALNGCKTCSCRWVDLYEEAFDMTEETFLARLDAQKQAIKADLAAMYETKRKNLLIVPSGFSGPEYTLSKKYHITRTKYPDHDDGPCYSFIVKVRDEMVSEGLLAKGETRYGTGYRTVKQKAKAKKTA